MFLYERFFTQGMWCKKGVKRLAEYKPVKIVVGVVLVLVGLAGLLIPILPGWLLIFVGLVWLGVIEREDIKRWLKRLRQR